MNAASPDPPDIPPETLRAVETRFHDIVRQRAKEFLGRDDVPLPTLSSYAHDSRDHDGRVWFPVSGMYGGFAYKLVGSGTDAKLIAASWSRVVGRSGQRHEITKDGTTLVERGFV